MSTITKELMDKQKQADWFSSLSDGKRKELLVKYGIDRKIEDGTLLNEDVYLIYKKEHSDEDK